MDSSSCLNFQTVLVTRNGKEKQRGGKMLLVVGFFPSRVACLSPGMPSWVCRRQTTSGETFHGTLFLFELALTS